MDRLDKQKDATGYKFRSCDSLIENEIEKRVENIIKQNIFEK